MGFFSAWQAGMEVGVDVDRNRNFTIGRFVEVEVPRAEGNVQDRLYEVNITRDIPGLLLVNVVLDGENGELQADFSPLAIQVYAVSPYPIGPPCRYMPSPLIHGAKCAVATKSS